MALLLRLILLLRYSTSLPLRKISTAGFALALLLTTGLLAVPPVITPTHRAPIYRTATPITNSPTATLTWTATLTKTPTLTKTLTYTKIATKTPTAFLSPTHRVPIYSTKTFTATKTFTPTQTFTKSPTP